MGYAGSSIMWKILFYSIVLTLLYTYVGYPITLNLILKFKKKRTIERDEYYRPTVSLIVPAHNEEDVIKDKIENSLKLDYPKEKFQVHIVPNGCTDETIKIAEQYLGQVSLHIIDEPCGKFEAIRRTIDKINSQIIVLTDANVMVRENALRNIIRNFADKSIGCVSADVRLSHKIRGIGKGEGEYYNYERKIQEMETYFT